MKTGMNLLLWTDHVTEAQDAILDQIKVLGFDAVEIPIFDTSDLAPYAPAGQAAPEPGAGRDGRHRDGAGLQSDLARSQESATRPWPTSTG